MFGSMATSHLFLQSQLFLREAKITYKKLGIGARQSLSLYSGFGRGLPGSPVEDPAEPISTRHPPASCCRVPGQLSRPSQVHPRTVSLFVRVKTRPKGHFDPASVPIPSLAAPSGPAWTC